LGSVSVAPGVVVVTTIDPRTRAVKLEQKFQPPALAWHLQVRARAPLRMSHASLRALFPKLKLVMR